MSSYFKILNVVPYALRLQGSFTQKILVQTSRLANLLLKRLSKVLFEGSIQEFIRILRELRLMI